DDEEHPPMRVSRGLDEVAAELAGGANILNFWVTRFARPLLVPYGSNPQADSFLERINFRSALVVPLLVSNLVRGAMHLYSRDLGAFTQQDAQLLWILALVA